MSEETNWAIIEADYRVGIKSLRQIAGDHSITEGAIRKRAKKEDWVRDLAERVRQRADELVRKEAVRSEVRENTRVPEREIIETNAQMQADKLLEHRADIVRYRRLCQTMLAELEAESENPEIFAELGEILGSPDEKGQDRLNEAYKKAISLPQRIDGVKKLAETLKTLIGLERQAFGISDTSEGDKAPLQAKPTIDAKNLSMAALVEIMAAADAAKRS